MVAGGRYAKNLTLPQSIALPASSRKRPMHTTSARPPILSFLLAFVSLLAVALFLATLAPTPEQAGDGAAGAEARGAQRDANDADRSRSGATR
jgi:hypothetical protein